MLLFNLTFVSNLNLFANVPNIKKSCTKLFIWACISNECFKWTQSVSRMSAIWGKPCLLKASCCFLLDLINISKVHFNGVVLRVEPGSHYLIASNFIVLRIFPTITASTFIIVVIFNCSRMMIDMNTFSIRDSPSCTRCRYLDCIFKLCGNSINIELKHIMFRMQMCPAKRLVKYMPQWTLSYNELTLVIIDGVFH